MPIRNEAAHLEAAVAAVLTQEYEGVLRLYLAIGPSGDDTWEVAQGIASSNSSVNVVSNEAGITPAGLNLAIQEGEAPVIVRVDGHSKLNEGYIQTAVELLEDNADFVNVGGIQRAVGETVFESAVAAAMTSRVGVGNAVFHYGGSATETDTVYLGVFRRQAIEKVGLFDESLIRNQDYELNWRLREAGGVIYFDPRLSVEYRPRSSVRTLAKQYFQYGQWKRVVIKRHPGSLRARQLAAPLLVLGLAFAVVLAPWKPVMLLLPGAYALSLLFASLYAAVRKKICARPAMLLTAVFATMHISWGVGFFRGAATAKK